MPNSLIISGRLGKPIEAKQLANPGEPNARLNFSMAFNEGRGDAQKSAWLDVTVFGKHADTVYAYGLQKGQEVVVTGRLSIRETGKDATGQYDRPIFTCIASFVEPGRMSGEGRGNAAPAAPQVANDEIPQF